MIAWCEPAADSRFATVDGLRVHYKRAGRGIAIARISAPTLVLRSVAIDGQHFARDIPDSRELVHADGGHLLPEEDPEWVAGAVEQFLHSIFARRRGDRQ